MTQKKKISKQEIKNIIEKGWQARREKIKKQQAANNEYTKKWKEQEVLFQKFGIPLARERREGHYITTPDLGPGIIEIRKIIKKLEPHEKDPKEPHG